MKLHCYKIHYYCKFDNKQTGECFAVAQNPKEAESMLLKAWERQRVPNKYEITGTELDKAPKHRKTNLGPLTIEDYYLKEINFLGLNKETENENKSL